MSNKSLFQRCAGLISRLHGKNAVFGISLFAFIMPISSASATATEPIHLAVGTSLPSMPFLVAEELGYFAREGLRIQLDNCQGAFRCMTNMLDGQAQYSSAGDLSIMFTSVERKDFVILATYSNSQSILKILTRKSLHLTHAEDFVGKRVGVIPKSATHYFLDHYLLTNGVDPQGVRHVMLDQEQMGRALADGSVDALSTYEPMASKQRALLGNDAYELAVPAFNLGTQLVALRKTVQQSPDTSVKILRALDAATQFIAQEPVKSKAILSKRSGLEASVIDSMWAGSQFPLSLAPSLVINLQNAARWAAGEHLINETQIPDFKTLLYPEPLNSVRPKGAIR